MPKTAKPKQKQIEPYEHHDKDRLNNPPVGLVNADSDQDAPRKTYAYDPHLDPSLQWAGKAERTSFEVPTVSLHVHERIDPRTIIEAVRRRTEKKVDYEQLSLFHTIAENPPLREAIEFYKHKHGWSNRLVAGDSLLVMNSLLEKEGLGGQVQMIYIDPPYGIKYGSNFQPFVNKREVTDGKDEDLNQEPEMVKAFQDTWELEIHSYLSYLRDRLLLARELLSETGSLFVQISDRNVHLIKSLLDEIFGADNFASLITFRTATSQPRNLLASVCDYIVWFCKNTKKAQEKYHAIFRERTQIERLKAFGWIELTDGNSRPITNAERNGKTPLPEGRLFKDAEILEKLRDGENAIEVIFNGEKIPSPKGRKYIDGVNILIEKNRVVKIGDNLVGKRYENDFPYLKFTNIWDDTVQGTFELTKNPKKYVVQTNPKVIARCMLMVTDPGDLVFDPTCGGGTTAYVAEQYGRRWITCDTSRISITLAKQRLMTALYDYYELKHPDEGVGSGFNYLVVPHLTVKSFAKKEPSKPETIYTAPVIDDSKVRVTGPFTVEAVPAPVVRPLGELPTEPVSDASIARTGETLRQSQWREELLQAGAIAKSGERLRFSRVEPLAGTRWLQAEAETKEDKPQRAVISFGPTFAPFEQRQVEMALDEASHLVPRPSLVIFVSFQFDPEAAKDIFETNWPGVTLLLAQMNTDLLTEDLKKKRSSSESFWLIGQPDVRLVKIAKGNDAGKYQVEVAGFDYYDPRTGTIESGGVEKIALWMLDTDYDRRALYPRQVFFPISGEKDGWARLARNLKAEIDEDLIEAYRGTLSLPFESAPGKAVAVKIVDDRGIESLKIIEVEQ